MSQPLLLARDITTWRSETCVLDNVTASIDSGSVVQIVGPNGSGKTTLLRTMAGLALPDEGQVFWNGKALEAQRAEYQQQLLYLGHKAGISGALTPRENLSAFLMLRHAEPNLERLDEALAALGLGDKLDLPCRWLSAGQQRRVALARLVLEPVDLWILDEPLNALDVDGADWVVQQIERQVERHGSVVFTTHQVMPFTSVTPVRFELSEAELAQ